jgi:hypothetical protein
MGGFSCEAYEEVGGNGVEYSRYNLFLHISRLWSYYAWKIVLPLCISTAFCFTAFLYELDDLSNRNGTSVTMFLATSALLYVVASVLPKTSYLTVIDRFVVQTLLIQFMIGVWSWIGFGFARRFRLSDEAIGLVDLGVFLVMVGTYLVCVAQMFWRPMRLGLFTDKGIARFLEHDAFVLAGAAARQAAKSAFGWTMHYHAFAQMHNVWPRKKSGEAPVHMLKPHWDSVGPQSRTK